MRERLLLLLDMNRVLTQTRTKLLQLQFLSASSATQRVVVITRLFANEMNNFFLPLALSHDPNSFVLCLSQLLVDVHWYRRDHSATAGAASVEAGVSSADPPPKSGFSLRLTTRSFLPTNSSMARGPASPRRGVANRRTRV